LWRNDGGQGICPMCSRDQMSAESSGNPGFRGTFPRDPKGTVQTLLQLWKLLTCWPESKPRQRGLIYQDAAGKVEVWLCIVLF